MKRRTLDLVISSGGLVLAGLLLIVGLTMYNNAKFADDYTASQLGAENITFKEADELTDTEVAWTNARTGCLFTYAGETVATGRHAECYANEFVGGHLRDVERAWKGMSYAELGTVQSNLRAQIAEAEANADPNLETLQEELTATTDARETVFKGTMLRNSLLTAYGFSVLGERAGQAATAIFMAAGVLSLLAMAGFVHALLTPKDRLLVRDGTEPAEIVDHQLVRT